jgi:hypothetical protein
MALCLHANAWYNLVCLEWTVCVSLHSPDMCLVHALSFHIFSISVFISSPFSVVIPPRPLSSSVKRQNKKQRCVSADFCFQKKCLAPCRDNSISGVEGLYCKRPIQCLASSEILTPHDAGEGHMHSLGGEGVGVNSSEDARHCSVFYICEYYVISGKVPYIGG